MPRATSINPMLSQAILNRRLQSKVEQRRRDPELSLLRAGRYTCILNVVKTWRPA